MILMPFITEGNSPKEREFNSVYRGEYLNRVAFPVGGIGAGMFCIEGNGSFSHFSLRHKPDIFNRPFIFAAISIPDIEHGARILEGPLQDWRVFGEPLTGAGSHIYGCPRFEEASFEARFPFGEVSLHDDLVPLEVNITGWSPFIPGDADNSSLPAGGLEYTFTNNTETILEAVFSFHSSNLMRIAIPGRFGNEYLGNDTIRTMPGGFILTQNPEPGKPHYQGDFAIFTDAPGAVTDNSWFRGAWFDARTILWKNIQEGAMPSNPPRKGSEGASIYVPFSLSPGESITIPVMVAWYVPYSDKRHGWSPDDEDFNRKVRELRRDPAAITLPPEITAGYHQPWYSGRFGGIEEVAEYWRENYNYMRHKSKLFADTFYSSDLPPVVLEAVAANLTILKSPTVLRQKDGKLWGFEGSLDSEGCCPGSCTHVWNYAQAVSRLFPSLERTLRETEFFVSQDDRGHQQFRANLPVRPTGHSWYAAADGQLGGIMKVYREWKISGNNELLAIIWPQVRQSLLYSIEEWDPRHSGVPEEPHHNTYDVEFWGPNGMIASFYLGALKAAIEMGQFLGDDIALFMELYEKGTRYLEEELFNGEYFIQKIVTEGLVSPDPATAARRSFGGAYSDEAMELLEKEGPKYQYGSGCLSDGVLGFWLAEMCGLRIDVDMEKVKSHLISVHRYNFRDDLRLHANPQRPSYAFGNEGGLLLCTWPGDDEPTLPFVYSNEVWTGIEYQVASHLMLMGEVDRGLEIVRALRRRYDGRIRNPFNEYECGHWYARAMASYGLIQGLTGVFFDAVEGVMYIDSQIGNDFTSFFACETGWGKVGLKDGEPFAEAVYGTIPVRRFFVSGRLHKILSTQ